MYQNNSKESEVATRPLDLIARSVRNAALGAWHLHSQICIWELPDG